VAEWFAPKADAAMSEDCYEISLELPGVATDDIDVAVQDGSLTIRGEKRFDHQETGRTYFFSEREYAPSSVPSACRPTRLPIASTRHSRTACST
jgi:HSP20 family protein